MFTEDTKIITENGIEIIKDIKNEDESDLYIGDIYHIQNKYIDIKLTPDHIIKIKDNNNNFIDITIKELYDNLNISYKNRYFISNNINTKNILLDYISPLLHDYLLNNIDEDWIKNLKLDIIIVPKAVSLVDIQNNLNNYNVDSIVVVNDKFGNVVKIDDYFIKYNNDDNWNIKNYLLNSVNNKKIEVYIDIKTEFNENIIEPLFVSNSSFILYLRNNLIKFFDIKVPVVEDEDDFLLNDNNVKYFWKYLIKKLTNHFTEIDDYSFFIKDEGQINLFLYDILNISNKIDFTVNDKSFGNFMKMINVFGYNYIIDKIPGLNDIYYKIKYHNKCIEITKNSIYMEYYDGNVYNLSPNTLVSCSNKFVYI